jgi:tRNA-2-methylthio-N6-dimethylallyladenosine synthase
MKTLSLSTAGCQINEFGRFRGWQELEHQLHLTVTDKPEQADVVVFNTCSIRDHAEQNYDAPTPIVPRNVLASSALIVTGCVAQQEGEAFTAACSGNRWSSDLSTFHHNVVDQVMRGQAHQVVVTEPYVVAGRHYGTNSGVDTRYERGEHYSRVQRTPVPIVWSPVHAGWNTDHENILKRCMDLSQAS